MKILLLSPPYLPEYMRNARCDFVSLSATQWYPILLGYCGAYLEGQGHDVKLVDAPANYLSHDETRRIIQEYKPDLLVLYSGRMSETNDIEFADPIVQALGCEAVIVGPYASIAPEKTLGRTKVIDKLIRGEFDHPVGELAEGRQPGEIQNLVWKNGDAIVSNPVRPNLSGADLDAIPFVSRFFRDHVNIRSYKAPSEYYPFIDIMTGRGCKWGRCTYCLWVYTYIKGPAYNVRSIPSVVEEFQVISKEMPQIRSVMIQDDTFVGERARAFSEAKLSAGITLPWSCYARADVSYETLRLMKRAGCRNLHVGYESADPDVLKRIKKGLSVDRMTRFTEDAKRVGLRIHGDFAIGFPGETPESAMKTILWARKLNPHTAQFQLMIPFPGTEYYQDMLESGWLNSNGEPDMPQFSNEQIRSMAKKAYRTFYLSPSYLWKCICHPYEHFFGRLKTISRAIPAVFWKRWGTSISSASAQGSAACPQTKAETAASRKGVQEK
ncbi:MAG: radical SAM protein [Candidatus Abyssobacteria bacterium SURF_5]|uniref:Radical SAM protein n=1 Tax=Abyssobacteria bacterium (strain SURF_5) TaxID=2093360 RepID=A0A3A4P1L7_ABYX5|nr:MAG: radical SAM protein [Candidatus Abyssubacteria bacterium SURF_5]